jgi:serine/threonine protein kinase
MTTELTVLDRRVRLERPLGRGATGEVWLARESDGGTLVLKFARDRAAYSQLAEEAQRLLAVDSPWCVRLLAAGRLAHDVSAEADGGTSRLVRGTPYLALEHHPGVTLDVALGRAERVALALSVARDAGRALSDLHASGVAHGDVKPQNLLVEFEAGAPRGRLMDFGLSSASDDAEVRGGTRRYLAPEVFDSASGGDARLRDLYALGVTLVDVLAPGVHGATPLDQLKAAAVGAELYALVAPLL